MLSIEAADGWCAAHCCGVAALVLAIASAAPATATVITFNAPAAEPAPADAAAIVVLPGGRRILLSDAFDPLILELSGDLDPRLVKAVVAVESGFDPLALSDRQAMGLLQITPETARVLDLVEPFDARANIEAGTRYLAAQLERFGDVRLALGAYNAGPDRIVQYRGLPPFPETRGYVRDVIALSDRLGANLELRPATAGASLFPSSWSGPMTTDRLKPLLPILVAIAAPTLAQAATLDPIQNIVDEIVTFLTGPLGAAIGTLVIAGVGLGAAIGRVEWRTFFMTLVGLVLVFGAATVVEGIQSTAGGA